MGNDGIYTITTPEQYGISIHVPAWGTTIVITGIKLKNKISIHVPAWGTTAIVQSWHCNQKISIHVPAWGTTGRKLQYGAEHLYFNPRSRVGNDRLLP